MSVQFAIRWCIQPRRHYRRSNVGHAKESFIDIAFINGQRHRRRVHVLFVEVLFRINLSNVAGQSLI